MSTVARLRCDGCLRIFASGASPLAARVVATAAGCLIEPGRDLCFDCTMHERPRAEPLELRPVECPVCGRTAGQSVSCTVSDRCTMEPPKRPRRMPQAVARIYRRAA